MHTLIESNNKSECETLTEVINEKLSGKCTATIPVKKRAKAIIYNVPKDIDDENLIENIIEQNNLKTNTDPNVSV